MIYFIYLGCKETPGSRLYLYFSDSYIHHAVTHSLPLHLFLSTLCTEYLLAFSSISSTILIIILIKIASDLEQ